MESLTAVRTWLMLGLYDFKLQLVRKQEYNSDMWLMVVPVINIDCDL